MDIQRECRRRVEAVAGHIPEPWDIGEFLQRLAKARGRMIVLRPFDTGGVAPCGLCLATTDTDYVLYPRQTTQVMREHVIFHEIAHLLHDTDDPMPEAAAGVIDAEFAALLFPGIPLGTVRKVLDRSGYSTRVEQLAEGFADELRRVVAQRQRAASSGLHGQQRAIAERLRAALEHRAAGDA